MKFKFDEWLKEKSKPCISDRVEEERRMRMGEGVEDRHWRPANVDKSCLAHPVAMDTVRSSSQLARVCERERERGKEREGEAEGENQQADIRASQRGRERAPANRVEGERQTERGGVYVWSERPRERERERGGDRKLEGDDRVLDNGGADGVCGASCGPPV